MRPSTLKDRLTWRTSMLPWRTSREPSSGRCAQRYQKTPPAAAAARATATRAQRARLWPRAGGAAGGGAEVTSGRATLSRSGGEAAGMVGSFLVRPVASGPQAVEEQVEV